MTESETTLYDTIVVYPIIFLPVLIMLYIVSSSFLNQNSSALVYGIGFIITLVFTGIVNRLSLSNAVKANKEGKETPSEYCFYGVPTVAKSMVGYLKASPNAAIIMYTFMYFISSTIVKNFSFIVNPILMLDKLFEEDLEVMILFICLLYFAKKVEKQLQCNNEAMNGLDYVNGMVVGFFAFWSYVTLFFVMGKESFFIQSHFLSNKKYCNSPISVTYRSKNEPTPKKYIIISDTDYIQSTDNELKPHRDQYYDKGSTNIVVTKGKSVYISPGTTIKYTETVDGVQVEEEQKYEGVDMPETITTTRARRDYRGDISNVEHYVNLRMFNPENTITINSIE